MAVDATRPAVLVEHLPTPDDRLIRYAGAWLASYSSRNTVRSYRRVIRAFFDWCRTFDLDPLALRRTHIDLWLRHLEQTNLAPTSRGNYLAIVRSFYGWAVDEDLLQANPAARVRRPPETSGIQASYTRTQMARLLEAAADAGGYDHATLLLLFGNGLRVSEACQADVADLGVDRYHRTLTIVGKGAKAATVPLPPATSLALDRALDGRQTGPLLLTQADTRASRPSVTRTLARLAKAADVPPVSPHAIRRTVIQLMLADGKTLREVQLFARHADPATTARYDERNRSLDESLAYDALRMVA